MTKKARDQYLAELESLLAVDGAARDEILAEVEDHLLDALAAGLDEDVAIERFGDPVAIAEGFNSPETHRVAHWLSVGAASAAAAAMFAALLLPGSGHRTPQFASRHAEVRLVALDPKSGEVSYATEIMAKPSRPAARPSAALRS